MTRYLKVVHDPLRTANYLNTDTITEISPVYDNYREELTGINISTVDGTYEHCICHKMSVNDANNIVERLIYRILDTRDTGNIINIDNYVD